VAYAGVPKPGKCKACASPLRLEIDQLIRAGKMSERAMSEWAIDQGEELSPQNVHNHKAHVRSASSEELLHLLAESAETVIAELVEEMRQADPLDKASYLILIRTLIDLKATDADVGQALKAITALQAKKLDPVEALRRALTGGATTEVIVGPAQPAIAGPDNPGGNPDLQRGDVPERDGPAGGDARGATRVLGSGDPAGQLAVARELLGEDPAHSDGRPDAGLVQAGPRPPDPPVVG
jgi:hypothetical protein